MKKQKKTPRQEKKTDKSNQKIAKKSPFDIFLEQQSTDNQVVFLAFFDVFKRQNLL